MIILDFKEDKQLSFISNFKKSILSENSASRVSHLNIDSQMMMESNKHSAALAEMFLFHIDLDIAFAVSIQTSNVSRCAYDNDLFIH